MRLVNPVTRLFAGRMPGFGLLTYRGRTTGRIYHLPINVFQRGEHYIFVLTYGSESQWVIFEQPTPQATDLVKASYKQV